MSRFRFANQGPGFPPDKQDTLFDMFARGVPESATPGVGLGSRSVTPLSKLTTERFLRATGRKAAPA